MSVPLDRLYNFVDSLCGGDVIIYRFSPHGSKKITDLKLLKQHDPAKFSMTPRMICHDQEPLCYAYYSDPARIQELNGVGQDWFLKDLIKPDLVSLLLKKNLRLGTDTACFGGNHALLLHSEQHSQDLEIYERSGFIGVYWWSHAMIAKDWFRFAQHDPDLDHKLIQQDFLVYNRAWSGTREYRLKFAECVIQSGLQDHCQMRFNPQEGSVCYQDHVYHNPDLTIHTKLERYFQLNTHDATASADYVAQDYVSTGMEIVLETLFDDTRWHLTEKILRPIACGQPFMLAATPGALAYLRSYGFNTFESVIDESYDSITDPATRLQTIIAEMRRIANLDHVKKRILFVQLREIAQHNRRWFFSSEFHHSIIKELQQNLAKARIRLQGS